MRKTARIVSKRWIIRYRRRLDDMSRILAVQRLLIFLVAAAPRALPIAQTMQLPRMQPSSLIVYSGWLKEKVGN